MKGRNGSTSFLPSKRKSGFQKEIPFEQCLTKDQTKHIYDKIETGEEIRIRKLVQQNILAQENRTHLQAMLISIKGLY